MKKTLKIIAWSAFVFYCLTLSYIFIIQRINFYSGYYKLDELLIHSNLIPFKTVYDYAVRIANDSINLDIAIKNLVGNLIVFLPMGCFLPCLFQKMRSFKNTALLVLGIVLCIEFSQILFGIGSFDIDDIIFNVGGGMIGYAIMCIPAVKTLCEKWLC